MKQDYQTTIDSAAIPVPDEVRVVMDELAGQLREGLLEMAVCAGLQVMHAVPDDQVPGLSALATHAALARAPRSRSTTRRPPSPLYRCGCPG
jgi:hypothetical protein